MLNTTLEYLTNSYNEIEQNYNIILSNENSDIKLVQENYEQITVSEINSPSNSFK